MDVFTCIAVEDLATSETLQSNVQCAASPVNHVHSSVERADVLGRLGLQDLNLVKCLMNGNTDFWTLLKSMSQRFPMEKWTVRSH